MTARKLPTPPVYPPEYALLKEALRHEREMRKFEAEERKHWTTAERFNSQARHAAAQKEHEFNLSDAFTQAFNILMKANKTYPEVILRWRQQINQELDSEAG